MGRIAQSTRASVQVPPEDHLAVESAVELAHRVQALIAAFDCGAEPSGEGTDVDSVHRSDIQC